MVASIGTLDSQFTSSRFLNPIGLGLLLFTGLNLNAVAAMFIGEAEMLSPLALALTLILLVQYTRLRHISFIYMLFVAAILSYLIMGSIPRFETISIDLYYIRLYFVTFLLVSALYFWIVSLDEDHLRLVLIFFKYLMLIACVGTIFSSTLQQYQAINPADAISSGPVEEMERASGLFENPNQAATAALYCLVLVVALPARIFAWRALQVVIAVIALVMTFSKAAMLGGLVLAAAFVLTRRSLGTMLLFSVAVATGIIGLWFIYEHDLFHLSWDQRERLADVFNLVGGEVSARTTTGRTVLVDFGLQKIKQVFPWGAGLGEFHAMEGGLRKIVNGLETNRWLGIHNTFLTILGESGLIPFLAFLSFLVWPVIAARKSKYLGIVFGFMLTLVIQMSAAHDVLLLRFTDAIVAITLAVATFAAREKTA
ncbi:O-antigen ligase family protein [Microvirga lotononidis]|uniref:O-Antigen ligase n=1 Tax=Microvirga lotononidis TaxID=864069 RepID=I4YYA8_9HYPH|nr:O-antigen ligase family protein [Microvirga lotononidis]EIM28950.1 O-Antigen ligase [Microvirga lotononidis]WQO26868.1 O-antigen ligase family protein [Microvirga lotononidis]